MLKTFLKEFFLIWLSASSLWLVIAIIDSQLSAGGQDAELWKVLVGVAMGYIILLFVPSLVGSAILTLLGSLVRAMPFALVPLALAGAAGLVLLIHVVRDMTYMGQGGMEKHLAMFGAATLMSWSAVQIYWLRGRKRLG